MLRTIRTVLISLFSLALLAAIALAYYEYTHLDNTPPVFHSEADLLEISIVDSEEALFTGLTATDDTDGDLTSKIQIKSISTLFNETDVLVEYLVFDQASNHATYIRTVRYQDYVSPRFHLNRSMVFRMGETVNIRDSVTVADLREGDITGKIKLEETTVVNTTPGVYSILLSATNEMGDTVYLPLTVQITSNSVSQPNIVLTDYLIYLNQGTRPQFRRYLESVTDPLDTTGSTIPLSDVSVNDADVNVDVPGVYEVYYYYTGLSGEVANVILTVVVE